jgi:hypothetical protein
VGLIAIFGVGALVFYRMRKKKMDLYPEILKVFVDNRSKIENFIGIN